MRPHTIKSMTGVKCEVGAEVPPITHAQAASRDKKDPEGVLGRRVLKDFGDEWGGEYDGKIDGFTREQGYHVTYPAQHDQDEDQEDVGIREMREILVPLPES
jgi:hypothetical protein